MPDRELTYGATQRTMATVIAVVTLIEGAGWHLLFRSHPFIAYPFDAVSLAVIAFLLWNRRELSAFPHLLGAETLVLRAGSRRSLAVPLTLVGELRFSATETGVSRADDQLVFAVGRVVPNVLMRLSEPLTVGEATYCEIAFALDDRSSSVAIARAGSARP